MKPGASLPRVFGKMRADTAPFIVGQIRGISLAVHGAKLRPPSRSPSTFQTVSLRGWVNKRSEGHLTRGGCRAKGLWAMERRRSATRSIHNNCVALAIL